MTALDGGQRLSGTANRASTCSTLTARLTGESNARASEWLVCILRCTPGAEPLDRCRLQVLNAT
eukprot:764721-Hanusia_phi.AAC.3